MASRERPRILLVGAQTLVLQALRHCLASALGVEGCVSDAAGLPEAVRSGPDAVVMPGSPIDRGAAAVRHQQTRDRTPGRRLTGAKGESAMRRPHSPPPAWPLAALVAAAGLLAAPLGAHAQEHDASRPEAHDAQGPSGVSTESGEHAGHDAHGEHPKNALALFLGGTLETAEDETFFTIGGEYERRLADRWAVQAVVEHVNDFDAWVVIAPVGFRVVDQLWIAAGPGFETDPRRPEEDHGGHEIAPHGDVGSLEAHEEEGGPFFLWRFGVNYGIHLNEKWGLMPSFNLDLVREHGEWVEAWVFGVSVAYHF
jgi:hypothetical protein